MLTERAGRPKNVCIYWRDVVFMFHDDGEDKGQLYNMNIENLQAKGWILA